LNLYIYISTVSLSKGN